MTDEDLREALRRMERRFAAQTEPVTVYDRVGEPLADYLARVAREIMLVFSDYPDEIANAPEPDATERAFEVYRERYGIDEDRDAAVIEALENYPKAEPWMDVRSRFGCLTSVFAEAADLETSDGETLEELVEAGRTDEADRLLVGETYDWLAERGGATAREATR